MKLKSTGGGAITTTIKGTSRGDRLIGTSGDDIIDGGSGTDTMTGGAGNDTYYVDSSRDVIVENGGEGIDSVYASADYTLSANVENLYLTGTKAVRATGNGLDNLIVGNGRDNKLFGGAGNDVLTGGVGNDTIDGGTGVDTATYAGNSTDYALTWTSSGLQVRALAGTDGSDLLTSVEFLRFADRTVTVEKANAAPVAVDDTGSGSERSLISGKVLANDYDPDGQVLKVTAVNGQAAAIGQTITLASGARVTLTADGNYTYDPTTAFRGLNSGQTGSDSFTYSVADGVGGTASATVKLSILGETELATPYYVQDLILADSQRWNYPSAPGTPAQVSFCFLDSVPGYYSATDWANTSFRGFTEAQRASTLDALAMIENYANLDFVLTTDVSKAAITFGIADMPTYVGYAYYPGGTGVNSLAGDVWLDSGYFGGTFTPGNMDYMVLIHEIGHAIGLDHPSTMTGDDATRMFTVMSYTGSPYSTTEAQTHMVYDIAAVQYLYGANMNSHTGNDVYDYAKLFGKALTLWDAGGVDTIDLSAAGSRLLLDLNPGEHSTAAASGANNFAIAFGTIIENAYGGSGDDVIVGNGAANVLSGGAGNDTLTGGAGADRYLFGARGWGDDVITDFQDSLDVIDLRGLGLTMADVAIASGSTGTTLSFGDDSILLTGISGSLIGTSDFLFT